MSKTKPDTDMSDARVDSPQAGTSVPRDADAIARSNGQAAYEREDPARRHQRLMDDLDAMLRDHVRVRKEEIERASAEPVRRSFAYTLPGGTLAEPGISPPVEGQFVIVEGPADKAAVNYDLFNLVTRSTLSVEELDRVIEFYGESFTPDIKLN
ncbi:hypothetical protein PUR21_21720 [Methylorubrum rhodesianum]|uniref:Uncharacterized protein n=1 Tax=Methylorubrum rhodesianum TaxID=29427 RepID=A0ABU9ZGW2_9HYPH